MNLKETQQIVARLVKDAGDILKKNTAYLTYSKGGMDFVTEADIEVDSFLKKELTHRFADIAVLTEETAENDFSSYKHSEYMWIVDPIDGTTNFSRGSSHFSISVGLTQKGKPILGTVYLPFEDVLYETYQESDSLKNGQTIGVSKRASLDETSIGFDFSWDTRDREKTVNVLHHLIAEVRQPRSLGCASADICLVAEGKMDGYFNIGLKPWDTAAASLILENAGGKYSRIDGSTWDVFHSDFLGSNSHIHQELLKLIL